MKGALRIARFFGIDVAVHWSFLLLVVYVVYVSAQQQAGLGGTLTALAFMGAIFTCVVMHEFGHALTARAYGVRTRHITLLPIGGVAALERMPTKPVQELLIAVAGPAVNVVIAAVLLGAIWLLGDVQTPSNPYTHQTGFFTTVAIVNIILVIFNMIPAFPMDGGRVLRALLALRLDYGMATRAAAMVGRVMAVGLLLWGVVEGNIVLMLIAVFVFMGGGAEAAAATWRASLQGVPVEQVMTTSFQAVTPDVTFAQIAEELGRTPQRDFPVIDRDSGELLGMLRHADLAMGHPALTPDTTVRSVMRTDLPTLYPGTGVFEAMETLRVFPPALAVVRENCPIGVLTTGDISLFLQNHATAQPGRRTPNH